MSSSSSAYDELIAALKDLRREGLSERSVRTSSVLRRYFDSGHLGWRFIERLILHSDPADGLSYLIGAYAMQGRFTALDLTRRRKMFADIIGVSERTLIRREDAAIERLADGITALLGARTKSERTSLEHEMTKGAAGAPTTPDGWIANLTAENSGRVSTAQFSPTSDLLNAVQQSVSRLTGLQADAARTQKAIDKELQSLQGLIARLGESNN